MKSKIMGKTRKLLSVLLVLALVGMVPAVPAFAEEGVIAGDEFSFNTTTGTLTITDDGNNGENPWIADWYSALQTALSDAELSTSDITTVNVGAKTSFLPPPDYSYGYFWNGWDGLEAVNVDSDNANFSSVEGVLFDKAKQTLLCYPKKREAAAYSIPEGVVAMNADVFARCNELTSISLPSTLLRLYNDSQYLPSFEPFYSCTNLETISVASGNAVFIAEDGVLYDKAKSALISFPAKNAQTSYTLPATVSIVNRIASKNLTRVVIPDDTAMTRIPGPTLEYSEQDARAFKYYASGFTAMPLLESITIPAAISSIGILAFSNCSSLDELVFKGATPPAILGQNEIGSGAALWDTYTNPDYPDLPLQPSASGTLRCPFGAIAAYTPLKTDFSLTLGGWSIVEEPATATKDISRFVLAGVEGTINGTDISLVLPSGTNVTSLAPTITHTGASISLESGTAQNFTTPVVYTVTAGDSSTKIYTVTVTVATISNVVVTRTSATEFSVRFNSNLAGDIQIFGSNGESPIYPIIRRPITPGQNTFGPGLPATDIYGDWGHLGETAAAVELTAMVSEIPVWSDTFAIPAWNDGKASTKDITSFKIGTVVGTISGTTISVTVPYATDVTSLTPAITHSGVSITPTGSQNFTRPITYTVKAEDGTTKAYTVTVSKEPPPVDTEWPRLDGNKGEKGGRYDTMQAIVSTGWKDEGSPYVIVASGMNFPDALAASSLAGIYGAPVVLTESSTLTSQAEQTIKDLGATKALVIGGEAAVSKEILAALEDIVGPGNVSRISGGTRISTALDIYEKGRTPDANQASWGDIAIIANGFSFADALSVSPFANVTRSPIFLSTPESMSGSGLDEATLAAINTGGFKRIIITGGTAAVPGIVEDQLASSGATVERWSGANRYETSAAIVENSLENSGGALSLNNIVCATGFNYPDALAGGAFAGHIGTVLLLVHAEAEGGRTGLSIIEAHKDEIGKGYILGGSAAVPDELLTLLQGGAR
ncbi:MAG: cell wall-binding repeat-containing protein [Coriobacteriales bacterium]|nr:cell wall-binding repeat-containing protein [Coriobacteriales bacterium]